MNTEPIDLTGKTCAALINCEFWLEGKLVGEVCALFLKTEDAGWYKIYLNDENYSWELKVTEEVPIPGQSLGDKDFSYPLIDIGADLGLTGSIILSFTENDTGAGAEALLRFENGRELVLLYCYDDETTQTTCRDWK